MGEERKTVDMERLSQQISDLLDDCNIDDMRPAKDKCMTIIRISVAVAVIIGVAGVYADLFVHLSKIDAF